MKKLFSVTLLLILMLSWATPALAQGGDGGPGQVVFGRDLTLKEDDVIEGDLVVFGGNLDMEDGSRVEGDVVIFGGSGKIDGEIEGDLALIGGSASLGPTARVDGDVASIGGEVDLDEAAYVRGQIIETTRFDFGRIPLPPIRAIPPRPDFDRNFGFEPFNLFFRIMLGFAQGIVTALVVSAIGLLVVLFLPEHTQTVGRTINQVAPASFGVGLLTLLVGTTVMVLLFITCCLIPVGLLLALALILATLYGWIVVGYLLGGRMLRALQKDKEPAPAATALVGIFIVTLVQQGLMALSHIPCLGFLFWLLGAALWVLIASTGLGAVVLTRFGTQPYTGSTRPQTPPALPPTAVDEAAQLEAPDDAASEPEAEPEDTESEGEGEATEAAQTDKPAGDEPQSKDTRT
jgi:cytoskeletal protein CcmA (bactofilin family)